MRAPFSHMNSRSHHEFNWWDPPFMWEEGTYIYGTLRIHNNFPQIYPYLCIYHAKSAFQKIIMLLSFSLSLFFFFFSIANPILVSFRSLLILNSLINEFSNSFFLFLKWNLFYSTFQICKELWLCSCLGHICLMD